MAQITHWFKSATETTITVGWGSDSVVDRLWYSLDNGLSWESVSISEAKSGTYEIRGLRAGVQYTFVKTRVRFKSDQSTKDSLALTMSTYDWPYCTDAPNFEIGENVELKFYNPLKRHISIAIKGNGQLIATTGTIGDSLVFGDTDANKAFLYQSIPNAFSARYTVTVTYGTLEMVTQGGMYTVNTDESLPTFTDFECYDANPAVVAITGNNQVLVRDLSTVAVKIPSANKMVAKNYATPLRYIVHGFVQQTEIPYADGDINVTIGTMQNGPSITVTAYDSRNLFQTVHKTDITAIPYKKPVVYATAKRLNNFENLTTLSVKGTYSPVVVDGVEKNGLISLAYKYREVGGDWIGSGGFNFTAGNGEYECEDTLKDLDNSKEYEFEVTVIDKFNQATTETASVDVGQAIFFVSSNLKKCFINGKEVATIENVQTVGDDVPTIAEIIDATHPVGSVFITSTNTNPNTLLKRGSWTLIDKEFTPSTANTTDFFNADELITNSGGYLVRGGHSIRVRQLVTIDVQANDEDLLLGNFLWERMGINNIAADMIERMSFSDGANGGIVYYVANASGNVTVKDVFDAPSVSGKKFYLEFVIVVDHSRMIDSYCNKFYWKRTS